MNDPFDELDREHRLIEKFLEALEAADTRDVPLGFYERAVEFAAQYVDAYHHTKEEKLLFSHLEERGLPRDYGPLGIVVSEHDAGRHHVEAMRGHIATGDVDGLRREARDYVVLMRDHLEREDDVLFPMGRALLTPEEIEEVRQTFGAVPEPAPSCAAYVESVDAMQSELGTGSGTEDSGS